MGDMTWGMLAPETVMSTRRTRTLGLGRAVRMFNELAVPGLGGLWFGKQLFLAALGIAVAAKARSAGRPVANIRVAEAIEALGCWMQYRQNDWLPDRRLRGIEKLSSVEGPASFSVFGKQGFYVTQPMRMGTVQSLRALGLVSANSERFNAYECAEQGMAFIEAACEGLRPSRRDPVDALATWIRGGLNADTETMRRLLSPVEPLPALALEQLRELLVRGDDASARRRRAAVSWIDALIDGADEVDGRPEQLTREHWHDLQAGGLFFALQKAGIAVLDAVEVTLAMQATPKLAVQKALTDPVKEAVLALRKSAGRFLDHGFIDAGASGADQFARECANTSDKHVVQSLLLRDERVLRLRDGAVFPGPAYDPAANGAGQPNGAQDPGEPEASTLMPSLEGFSQRVWNLYLLCLDLRGELNELLTEAADE